jgi:demethoxyubiquinone hydroxylase (CLK1/Coq7/Cat5 family)
MTAIASATPTVTPHVSDVELRVLDFYRASELHGGLVLGAVAQRARQPELIVLLTRHAAEEVVHAQLWAETIVAVGGRPRPVRRTYQARLAERVGAPSSLVRVLALTQVFERRVYRHFQLHLRRPGTHPLVCATLERMLHEERDHLRWVHAWLDREARRTAMDLPALLARYRAVDDEVYADAVRELGWEDM